MVAGYTSQENNERKHLPVSFLHTDKFFLAFFCGGSSSMDSSLSQSTTTVRDPSGHSPDSSDVASVANVLDGTDAAESGTESSGADAAGG